MAEHQANNIADSASEASSSHSSRRDKSEGGWSFGLVIQAVLIAALVHTLLFRPFFIPSGSMKPSLLIGDYLIINKFSYGYSRFSCYFALCPIKGRIFGREPKRGEVVVFANPGTPNHEKTYVKRLIGLPGDKIALKDGVVFINGEEARQEPLEDYAEAKSDFRREEYCTREDEEFCYIEHARETLPGGVEHPVFNFGDGRLDNIDEFTIPEGHYFMVGDNRDNSNDSRADVGLVPAENLIGRPSLIVFSSSGSSLFQFWRWRSDRFFQKVR